MCAQLRNKVLELEGIKLMSHPVHSLDLDPSVSIKGSLLVFKKIQQPRGGGSFSDGVLHLKLDSKSWHKSGFRLCNTIATTLNSVE